MNAFFSEWNLFLQQNANKRFKTTVLTPSLLRFFWLPVLHCIVLCVCKGDPTSLTLWTSRGWITGHAFASTAGKIFISWSMDNSIQLFLIGIYTIILNIISKFLYHNLNHNRNLQISKAPLKSQLQYTSLFTSAVSNQRDCPEDSPWEVQV